VALSSDIECADECTGEDHGVRGLGYLLSGAVLLPPLLYAHQPLLDLRQRRCDLTLHDLNAQGFEFSDDDIDLGASCFLRRLDTIK
jgi:hypothetical protein